MTPITHVSGWRQRRNAHHHSAPTTATMKPHSTDGRVAVRLSLETRRQLRAVAGATFLPLTWVGGDVRLVAQLAQRASP